MAAAAAAAAAMAAACDLRQQLESRIKRFLFMSEQV